jgi:TPP-dependent pyruvate/acetoin dehydrogenase alpha subunit
MKNTNVASRASGYGMPGYEVDGMDVLSMYKAAKEAIRHATYCCFVNLLVSG